MEIKILYEDNHLIAVFKPAGVLVQPDISKKICLMDEVKKYLKKKYNKKGKVFLGLLHRIDQPVSGVVLFAKTSKGASRLSEQFRNNEIEKVYKATVVGKVEKKQGVLIDYIIKDEERKKAMISDQKNGKRAELHYKVVSSNDKCSFLEIKIKTGRFHQIRVQLSSTGHPIVGDVKYGAPFFLPDKSIALCAASLSFKTAVSKEKKTISVPEKLNFIFKNSMVK
jgi:23S rRNA pseudouridine1911/1915/1917 synthase